MYLLVRVFASIYTISSSQLHTLKENTEVRIRHNAGNWTMHGANYEILETHNFEQTI